MNTDQTERVYPFEDWKCYALTELGGIFSGIFEYERPIEIAVRLEAIAHELKSYYNSHEANSDRGIAADPCFPDRPHH